MARAGRCRPRHCRYGLPALLQHHLHRHQEGELAMREYTLIDAHGNAFVPMDPMDPDLVWVRDTDGDGAWVPWSIVRCFPEETPLEEIVAELKAESEEVK